MAEFVCVNDEEANCGTVTNINQAGKETWVHTGRPNAASRKNMIACADSGPTTFATPSTMEIVEP